MLLQMTKKKLLVRSLLFLMGLITRMQDQRPIKVSLQNVQEGRGTKVKYLGGYFLIGGYNGDGVTFSRMD